MEKSLYLNYVDAEGQCKLFLPLIPLKELVDCFLFVCSFVFFFLLAFYMKPFQVCNGNSLKGITLTATKR